MDKAMQKRKKLKEAESEWKVIELNRFHWASLLTSSSNNHHFLRLILMPSYLLHFHSFLINSTSIMMGYQLRNVLRCSLKTFLNPSNIINSRMRQQEEPKKLMNWTLPSVQKSRNVSQTRSTSKNLKKSQ